VFYEFQNKNQQYLQLQRLIKQSSIKRRRPRSTTADNDKKTQGEGNSIPHIDRWSAQASM